MTKVQEENIHMIEFSGKHSSTKFWLHKFPARCNKKVYNQHIDGTANIPIKVAYQKAKSMNTPSSDKKEAVKDY